MKRINSSHKLVEFLSGRSSADTVVNVATIEFTFRAIVLIEKFVLNVQVATVYAPVCTTNPQVLIVICCIHLHIHHMPRILFLILSFLDFVVFVVRTLIFP